MILGKLQSSATASTSSGGGIEVTVGKGRHKQIVDGVLGEFDVTRIQEELAGPGETRIWGRHEETHESGGEKEQHSHTLTH